MKLSAIVQYANSNRNRYVEELKELVKIASISGSPEHKEEVKLCARFLRDKMEEIGFMRTELYETSGNPIIYGEWLEAPGKPTVLIYGHYDVQPVDPLDMWETSPFEPDVRHGKMYGRGTVDDKGQIYIHLKAIESWLKVEDALPLNVKFIVEGEEEVGSENLGLFLVKHQKLLEADVALISDTPMFRKGMPSICYGLRGLAYFQINLRGSNQDLHSGSFGGALKNPIHALTDIVNRLKEKNGRIAIPGFYDDVVDIGPEEREALAGLPFDEEAYRKEIGAPKLYGESGYSVLENIWCRPTLDVCGIWGGFTEEGAKTIIPAEAHAKVSMRLVPNQNPEKIGTLFEEYIDSIVSPEMFVTVDRMHGGKPFLGNTHHYAFEAARKALERGFGAQTVYIREGGSIPVLQTLSDSLNLPCLLIGFGLPNENAHAPNEWLDLENYHKGILSIIYLYMELSEIESSL